MDSQQKRLMITLALCFALTAVWMWLFPPTPPKPAPEAQKTEQVAKAPSPAPTQAAPTPAPQTPPGTPAAPAFTAPVRTLTVDRGPTHVIVSSVGGSLTDVVLQGDKMREQGHVGFVEAWTHLGKGTPPPPQMDLAVPPPNAAGPLAVELTGANPLPATAPYVMEGPQGDTLSFHTQGNGWDLKKALTFPKDVPTPSGDALPAQGYTYGYDITVTNTTAQARTTELAVHFPRSINPGEEVKPSYFGGVGNLSYAGCRVGKDYKKRASDDKPAEEFKGQIHFIGVDQQYFLSAIYPLDAKADGRCVINGTATLREAVAYFPVTVQPGQSVTRHFGVFLGPKDLNLLDKVSAQAAATLKVATDQGPMLDKTVGFGVFAVIAKVLVPIMNVAHSLTGSWGLAIILLTVFVKLLLLPLIHKSMVSQEAMRKLQPKMEALKKKYKDDKERQQIETMRLYKEEKVNPFGGCIPMLIQLPIWFALYEVLRNSFELYRAPFLAPLWHDLTFKDPTYVIPVLLVISQILTTKLQPQPMMDATQAKVMTFVMPVFFGAVMLNYPLGLNLYIFTNNVLTVAQQYGLRKYLEKRSAVGAPALERRK